MELDGEDVVRLEEGVDVGVSDVWEEVEEVLGVVLSGGWEVEVDCTGDVEESVDEDVGVDDVEEETEVSVGDVDVVSTDGDCVLEGVGVGVGVGVKDGASEDALR